MPPLDKTHNILSDVEPYAITICKQGANRKRIYLKKEGESENAALHVLPAQHRILKEGDSWEVFYCVVAEPGWVEDPGQTGEHPDVWGSPDEIRKAAHNFARSPMLVNAFHESIEPYGSVVENFVAQADFEVGGEKIKKDSWVVGIMPSDQGRTAIDSGELTGISIEGTGTRTLVKKDGWANVDDDGNLSVTITGNDPSVWQKFIDWIKGPEGIADAEDDDSATIQKTNEEDSEVADKELEEKVEQIAKAQGAATTAIEGLVGTVNSLVDKLDAKNKTGDEDENSPEKLKKSIEELGTSMQETLTTVAEGIDALAQGGSTQTEPVQKSSTEADWRVGLF